MRSAFVFPLSSTGLAAVRSLGRAGIPVVAMDADRRTAGLASGYARPRVIPSPGEDPEALLAWLVEAGRRLPQPGVLFPASDEAAQFISRRRHHLAPYFTLAVPPADAVELAIDKQRQYALAESLGIAYPETHYPRTAADVRALAPHLSYPAFLKANQGHLWRRYFPR